MTTRTMLHHAGNTPFLARMKDVFNGRAYGKAALIFNADGEAAARAYLGQFVKGDLDRWVDDCLAALARQQGRGPVAAEPTRGAECGAPLTLSGRPMTALGIAAPGPLLPALKVALDRKFPGLALTTAPGQVAAAPVRLYLAGHWPRHTARLVALYLDGFAAGLQAPRPRPVLDVKI